MPNTIAENLQRLAAARTAISNAIITKGGTVNAGDGLEEFPDDINTIPTANLTALNVTENGTYYESTPTEITSTSFPITLNDSLGTPLLDYLIDGNMSQTGTPTPTTPIQPSECGDMSSNLWSYHPDITSGGVRLLWDGEKINYSNTCTQAANSTMVIDLKKGTYTLKVNANRIPVDNDNSCVDIFHQSSGLLKRITNRNAVNGKVTFTLDDDLSNVSLRIRVNKGTNYDGFEIRPMLNIGETSLPYDVYGQYKIPISSADTTTNIYLGEVETTRKIKKLVLTGEEAWVKSGTASNTFYTNVSGYLRRRGVVITICSHYISQANINAGAEMQDGNVSFYANLGQPSEYFYIRDSHLATVADLKTFLAQQYAAGTPVIVWYVLAEPTTGIVNEPLRKIGDYADEVSGITIPTITGANTIDVDTTLKPSEVSVNYKGWHFIQSLHRFNGSSWD